MKESQIHQHVIDRWKALGKPDTLLATIPNMRAAGQAGLTKGLPDLIAIGPHLPVGFLELKTETGRLSEHQKSFGELCQKNKVRYAVTHGLDEAINILEVWGIVRGDAA